MSLQWTLVTWFVYGKVGLILVMCLPIISVQRWRRILRSRLLRKFDSFGHVYFNVFLGLLVLLLLDAYRKMRNYSAEEINHDERINPHGFALSRMRKFRSQSNLTLASGALLLWLVLKWIIRSLISRAFVEEDLAAERAKVSQLKCQLNEAQRKLDKYGATVDNGPSIVHRSVDGGAGSSEKKN